MALYPVLVAAVAPPEIHTLVVAHNRSADGQLTPLRFADDDGARWFERMKLVSTRVRLLTLMDPATQRLHPEAAASAHLPSKAELDAALKATFAEIQTARAKGRRSLFYFIYIGHGSVGADGTGRLHLFDQTLSRRELFVDIIGKSPATINHVIIDACHALSMVAGRGDGSTELDQALEAFLDAENLQAYPNTGVLVATSQSQKVHEWSRFQAGVFSHQLRSALAGAADVDLDRTVSYSEASGFVAAANARVTHAEARLEVFARAPPIQVDASLFDNRASQKVSRLHVPEQMAGRWWLEDDRGVRVADFHSGAGQALELTVPERPTYFLRREGEEVMVPTSVAPRFDVSELPRRPSSLASRGSEELAFRKDMFAVPFGRAWLEGFRASAPQTAMVWRDAELPEASGWGVRESVATALFVGATAAVVGGVLLAMEAEGSASEYRSSVGTVARTRTLRDRASEQATFANALFAASAALGGAGLLTLVW